MSEPMTTNQQLLDWVQEKVDLCQPDAVHWCDGSDEEYKYLCDEMVEQGTAIKLYGKIRPNSYLCRSEPKDVARVEHKTFICSHHEKDAGPTNNWCDPA
jgi:phosphoenolpyruvate carboxykinase (GTP)